MALIELIKGDITKFAGDAVVNAANTSLLGGGGVDGAIHRAGGSAVLEACQKIRNKQGGCKVGEAVITTAGNMPSKYVIHTVGPVWSASNPQVEDLLSSSYSNSLALALQYPIQTIAFPNISTGIYKFPKELACEIAIETVSQFLSRPSPITKVSFVCFDDENYAIYQKRLAHLIG
jgi:O-acetyl-ADP-ribose deacetylase